MDLRKVNKLLLLGVFLVLFSCDSSKKYDAYVALNNGVWLADAKVAFDVEIEDIKTKQHVFLNLRTDNNFPYRNLFVISKMTNPQGLVVKDTLEYHMADAFGNWLGDGFTDVRNNKLFFLENHQFKEKGMYRFEFEQAMRSRTDVEGVKELEGVIDVGLRIEAVKQ